MRFDSVSEIEKHIVLEYVKEAIENQKLGKEIKPDRSKSKKDTVIPKELNDLLVKNKDLKNSFESLSPYKQREYCEYIDSAKREATKTNPFRKNHTHDFTKHRFKRSVQKRLSSFRT